jgi:RNA polymerase sigma-70 factor, ECF subfamily
LQFTFEEAVDDDRDAVTRCLQGEEAAFAELFRRHEARVLRLAYALLGDREAAEDAKQEAFLAAFRSLDRMNADVAFSSWLHRNLVWATRAVSRRAYRRREVTGDPPDRDEFGAVFEDQDRRAALLAALRALPAGAREAVVLRFYLDLSESEIARLLGCRPGTVKSRISRALRRLAGSPALAELQPSKETSDVG